MESFHTPASAHAGGFSDLQALVMRAAFVLGTIAALSHAASVEVRARHPDGSVAAAFPCSSSTAPPAP